MQNSLETKEEKNSYQFRTKMPLGLIGQGFFAESNIVVFVLKLIDIIHVIFGFQIVTRKQSHVLYLRLYLGPKPYNFPMINVS